MTRTLPLNFPGMREESERLTVELVAAGVNQRDRFAMGAVAGRMSVAYDDLLADLTRPESQAFWLRALAVHQGLSTPRVGAPTWTRRPGGFYLWTPSGGAAFIDSYMCYEPGLIVIGIGSTIDNTAGDIEGLRLALHTAFGVPYERT